jgi:transposase
VGAAVNDSPSPHGTQQAREWRRQRAWQLKQRGWKQKDIAIALGVTDGAVSQWCKRAREGGVQALRHRPPSGPRCRLSAQQKHELLEILTRGAEAWQFRGDLWTTRRVAVVIQAEFGVRYHHAHVSRLLRQIGWSPQQPGRRASQRDEAAIQRWLEERWPALKNTRSPKVARSSG